MDPRDFNFNIRTGHNITGQETDRLQQLENTRTLMALMMTFNEKACLDGMEYAKAAGRTMLLSQDYILGLKYNAVPSTGFYSMNNLTEHVSRWRENETVSNFVSDAVQGRTDYSSEEEEEEEEVFEEEEWTRAPENTDFVRKVHAAEIEYESWVPAQDQSEAVAVKRAIDRAIIHAEQHLGM